MTDGTRDRLRFKSERGPCHRCGDEQFVSLAMRLAFRCCIPCGFPVKPRPEFPQTEVPAVALVSLTGEFNMPFEASLLLDEQTIASLANGDEVRIEFFDGSTTDWRLRR